MNLYDKGTGAGNIMNTSKLPRADYLCIYFLPTTKYKKVIDVYGLFYAK